MKRSIPFILALIALLNSSLWADSMHVIGPVYGVWDVDTVFVDGEIWVPENLSLTIQPGVLVIFQGYYQFQVLLNATLLAVGTAQDTIRFTASNSAAGWHGIHFMDAADSSQLQYCGITHGRATGGALSGGAIYCYYSNPTIQNCRIDSCWASGGGGGIYCLNSSPTISGNIISGNSAASSDVGGGGIYCYGPSSSPTISGNTISGNTATYYGGGIYCAYSSPTISGNTISGNSAYYGGGIMAENSAISMDHDTVANNSASSSGGGIYLYNSYLELSYSEITGNEATVNGGGVELYSCNAILVGNLIGNNQVVNNMGGGIWLNSSSATISNNEIINNQAKIHGGGIYAENSPNSPIVDNTISGNNSDEGNGGGIYCQTYNAEISGNSITENTAECNSEPYGRGGGIYFNGGINAQIAENLISQNSAHNKGGGIYCASASLTIQDNDILGNSCYLDGAGIYCYTFNGNMTNNNIRGNSAATGVGGGLKIENSDPILISNVIDSNVAVNGAGVYCWDYSRPEFVNCLICADSAQEDGGGIYSGGTSQPVLINCTMADNMATVHGGAIFSDGSSSAIVINSILWDTLAQDSIVVGSAYIAQSDVKDGWPAPDPYINIDMDPLFQGPSYELSYDSPCTGGGLELIQILGTTYSAPDSDIVGRIRPDPAPNPDQGANENPYAAVERQLIGPMPSAFCLHPNHPNPFNAATTIGYELPTASLVEISVFDLSGRMVAILADGWRLPGKHELTFDASALASGIYIYRLQTERFSASQKMVLLK